MDNENSRDLKINLPEDVADGKYSNMAIISHSSSEFVLDFVKMLPGLTQANVQSRVIMTPEHAKRLLLVLEENIKSYEKNFGEINLPFNNQNNNNNAPFTPPISGFKGEA